MRLTRPGRSRLQPRRGLLAHSSSQGAESVRHGPQQMGKHGGDVNPAFSA